MLTACEYRSCLTQQRVCSAHPGGFLVPAVYILAAALRGDAYRPPLTLHIEPCATHTPRRRTTPPGRGPRAPYSLGHEDRAATQAVVVHLRERLGCRSEGELRQAWTHPVAGGGLQGLMGRSEEDTSGIQ